MDQFGSIKLKSKLNRLILKFVLILLVILESSANNSSPEIFDTTVINEYGEGTEVTDQNIFFDTTTITFENAYAAVEDLTTISPFTSEEEYLESIRRRPVRNCDCGVPKLQFDQGIGRVIGGQPAVVGEFPWFAAITKFQHNKKPRWRVICGASLINSEFALTAAHCLHNRFKDTLEVVFNVKDTNNITTDRDVIRRKIKQFVIHPQYNPQTQDNDIALIQFKIPVDLQTEKRVVPICLPGRSFDSSHAKDGTFVGFGHTSYGSGSPAPKENSRILLKVNLPILSHAECLRSKVPTKKNVTEFHICAGSEEGGKDACINDSGGPLMTRYNGKAVILGLASWGVGCGLKNYPGVHTRISSYLNWIKLTATSRGISGVCF